MPESRRAPGFREGQQSNLSISRRLFLSPAPGSSHLQAAHHHARPGWSRPFFSILFRSPFTVANARPCGLLASGASKGSTRPLHTALCRLPLLATACQRDLPSNGRSGPKKSSYLCCPTPSSWAGGRATLLSHDQPRLGRTKPCQAKPSQASWRGAGCLLIFWCCPYLCCPSSSRCTCAVSGVGLIAEPRGQH